MKPNVTVIITTRDRPQMLAHALASVRGQTHRASVGQVIVSENGQTDESRRVCEAFPDLPLRYLRQNPPVQSMLHLKALWPQVEGSIVAILHDDDWWAPEHLERSVRVLETHPQCVGTYANFFDNWGPTTVNSSSSKAWFVWVASGCDFSPPVLILDKVTMLLACLLESSIHYSTLVGRKEAVWQAYLQMLAADNPWDNERIFPVMLANLGPVGYFTGPGAFVRFHPGQEGIDPAYRAKGFDTMRVMTTRWLAQSDPHATALAVKKFNQSICSLEQHLLQPVAMQIGDPQKNFLVRELGLNLALRSRLTVGSRWVIDQVFPPAVLALHKTIKKKSRPWRYKIKHLFKSDPC